MLQIERIRRQNPVLPILVYAPNRAGIAEILLSCSRFPGVRAELQQTWCPTEADRLRQLISSVIKDGPRVRLLRMIRSVDGDAPARAYMFIEMALRSIGQQTTTKHLTVANLAAELGVSERTLERSWHTNALPPPKELLEWLALLLAGLLSAQCGIPVARAARKLGMDTQQLYRLRRRLLPPAVRLVRDSFENVFLAFVERCRQAKRIVQHLRGNVT